MIGAPGEGVGSRRLPREREPLPLFTLPNTQRRTVRLWDFKQRRPVVLIFIHGARCGACRDMLAALAARREDLSELHAAVLVVAPDPLDQLARMRASLELPFILLSDADGGLTDRYVPPARSGSGRPAALYVADRYGACGLAATADEATQLPDALAILAEIALADEGTCACLVPAWPDE
jgi:peroxiredoxin